MTQYGHGYEHADTANSHGAGDGDWRHDGWETRTHANSRTLFFLNRIRYNF